MLIIRQHKRLQLIHLNLLRCLDQQFQFDLFRLFRYHVFVNQLSILEVVFQKFDTIQHTLALLRLERLRNINTNVSLEEYVDDHPICFMLNFFVGGVIGCQSDEFKYVE